MRRRPPVGSITCFFFSRLYKKKGFYQKLQNLAKSWHGEMCPNKFLAAQRYHCLFSAEHTMQFLPPNNSPYSWHEQKHSNEMLTTPIAGWLTRLSKDLMRMLNIINMLTMLVGWLVSARILCRWLWLSSTAVPPFGFRIWNWVWAQGWSGGPWINFEGLLWRWFWKSLFDNLGKVE